MQEFSTPMLRQYQAIKAQYKDCLLLYRMGDFYELFLDDALIGAQILNITLTKKSGGKDGKVPMAGVPYHAADTYIAKLVKSGYKVAICEQLSPPNKKGLVERDVVRIVTPGTLFDESQLEKKENNFIVSIAIEEGICAFSIADVSTGYFAFFEKEYEKIEKTISEECAKIRPSECILSDELYNDPIVLSGLKSQRAISIFPFSKWNYYKDNAKKIIKDHFRVLSLSGFAMDDSSLSLVSSAVLLGYLSETQKGSLAHIRKMVPFYAAEGLMMDRSTMINLELFSTIREHDTKGSLIEVMDHTITAMGGRMLKTWMKNPLYKKESIEQRYDAVSECIEKLSIKTELEKLLELIPDIERIVSRLSVRLGNARDLITMQHALRCALEIKKILSQCESELLQTLTVHISKKIEHIETLIKNTLVEEPPLGIKEGGMIAEGVSKRLDNYRRLVKKSKSFLVNLEKEERERTNINSLKVKYNSVFGFYIEISKANMHLVPSDYVRKQTLVNAERFITKELKEHEEIILSAQEKINEIEYELFCELVAKIVTAIDHIQHASESIAILDCIINFSTIAQQNEYIRPKLLYSGELKIKEGRHPVVERLLGEEKFVPNSIEISPTSQQILIITGPNMAGKSVYIRQVALIVLMAQMGCFIPASKAEISLVDKIFVRSGASDVITSGLSTFMVEMVETAYILHNATKDSLIIMDEIGRGTSTYDGISLAWAVAEYLAQITKPSPKTLFATHYHELQALETTAPGVIKNYHLAVAEEKGEPIFLHTVLPGGASHSFGVAVAKLAGIPEKVIHRAYELLQTLEYRDVEKGKDYKEIHSLEKEVENLEVERGYFESDFSLVHSMVIQELEKLDVGTTTPLDALNILSQLKDKIKLITDQKKRFSNLD